MQLLAAIVASYLIGSIPFGYLIARLYGTDIRQHGSGNIGATNVWRTLGPIPGLLALLGDAAKGALAVYLGRKTGLQFADLMAGLAAMVGHAWPVYLRFKGGKIIATGTGVMLMLSPQITLWAVLVFALVVATSRFVSLGSVCAAISVPVLFRLYGYNWPYLLFALTIAAIAVYKHIPNLRRIAAGQEFKVGSRKK
ncbi:MAG: glycerol-3-phosphate 1-O-acyltransferase PlsY [Bacillota bacterium]|uniref:glycerol-3-phosphate 1-O-acyltransferase PlsY n=1 Tax=Desulfurispora thermophila TaxID=265470 RepID=UPI00035E270E|nr:glycerol-3-phosphate 1-O-acyltransferase PlsY [Desulfurispora thermophila]